LTEQGIHVNISGLTELPPEVGTIQETFEFETSPEKVDVSGEEDLKKYVEAGNVKSVKIKYITLKISENSFNFDLPELQVFMGDHSITDSTSASKVAVAQSVPKQFVGDQTIEFTPNGNEIMSNLLLSYKFAVIGKALISIDTNETRTIPAGVMKGKVVVGMKFAVDPL
jgi:hypothetical protein